MKTCSPPFRLEDARKRFAGCFLLRDARGISLAEIYCDELAPVVLDALNSIEATRQALWDCCERLERALYAAGFNQSQASDMTLKFRSVLPK